MNVLKNKVSKGETMKTEKIYQGNCIEVLKDFPDESIDCVVTSPPYWGLRDYGTAEWEGGDENCEHKVGRITRGGLSEMQSKNIGGFGDESIKNGGSCPHCGAIRKDSQLGLEETPEEFVANLVRVFSKVKRVLKKEGTCWLNLGDTYSAQRWTKKGETKTEAQPMNKMKDDWRSIAPTKNSGLPDKNLTGIPWRVAFALQSDGWYLRQDIIWHKPNPMPESVQDRCTKAHEYIFLLTKSPKYFYDIDAIREPHQSLDDYKKRKNKTYSKNLSKGGTGEQCLGRDRGDFYNEKGRNKRSVWKISTKPYKEAHFATFPIELPITCIKAGCPEGGIVLDPFFGSGTTGLAAQELHRHWVGIELNPEYIEIANRRVGQTNLFV